MTQKLVKLKRKLLKLTVDNFVARLKQANSATKGDIDDFIEKKDFVYKLKNLNKKVTSNKKKTYRGWKETN